MDIDDVINTLRNFLLGLQTRQPNMASEIRRLELVLDEQGVLSIASDVGAGWAALR